MNNYRDIISDLNLQNNKNDEEISKRILSYLLKFKHLFEDNDIFKSEISNYRNDKIEIFKKLVTSLKLEKEN